MQRELQSPHHAAPPQGLVPCTPMLAHVWHISAQKPPALRTLIFAVVVAVFAVLNPLACVWHCALQDHLAEHGRRYVWICAAHQQAGVSDALVDGGDPAHLSAETSISAVHHGVIQPAILLVLALLVVVLDRAFVFVRRACATIVSLSPPPKHTLRYA